MSDYRAIGGVTATLRALLLDRMEQDVPVTTAPPDVENDEAPRINLFLYRLEESGSLKNQDLPGLAPGGGFGQPPLALELHYLMTAYAAEEDDRAAQELLGDAMRALHENSIVPRTLLDASVEPLFESIRICGQPTSLDDLTKIWSATTKPFRLSVCYRVTAIQIESRTARQYNRPVGEVADGGGPRIIATPLVVPHITRLLVIRQGDAAQRERPVAYAQIGDRLVIEGTALAGPARVFFGDTDVTAFIQTRTDRRMVVTIPDNAALQPGPIAVRLQADVLLGEPAVAHRGFPSNLAVFVLVPAVAAAVFASGPPRLVTITGSRLFQQNRPCFTLLGDTLFAAADYDSAAPDQVEIELPVALALGAGTYVVRVRVNGAESVSLTTVTIP